MGVIHIENVDDRIMDSIRLRADASGRSFEEEVSAVLAEIAGPSARGHARAEEARRIRAMTPRDVVQTDSTQIIRELRDGGYAGR